jgi:nucleoside-diphosphate-sugar epimerase
MSLGPNAAVLVTGAGGYVGAPTVRALISLGCDIHILGRTDPQIVGTTFHCVDLLTGSGLLDAIKKAETKTLLHLAWSVTPGKFWTDLENCDWVASSLTLFRAFLDGGGQRIVGVGSCAEYEWSNSPFIEANSPVRPNTLYGKAKAALWSLLEAMANQEQFSAAWARLFFLYGPGETQGKLVADAANALLNGKKFRTTEGFQRRDFIHVEDAGRALATLTMSQVSGAVNVASGKGISIRELLGHVAESAQTVGSVDFGAIMRAPEDPDEIVADVKRLHHELGFTEQFSTINGIAHTVDWWRQQMFATSRPAQNDTIRR